MSQVTFELPTSISDAEARFFLAMKLFELGRLSCAQAAELAGSSKREFIEALGKHGGAVLNYSVDEMASDVEVAADRSGL